jgi:hypothetical protein
MASMSAPLGGQQKKEQDERGEGWFLKKAV